MKIFFVLLSLLSLAPSYSSDFGFCNEHRLYSNEERANRQLLSKKTAYIVALPVEESLKSLDSSNKSSQVFPVEISARISDLAENLVNPGDQVQLQKPPTFPIKKKHILDTDSVYSRFSSSTQITDNRYIKDPIYTTEESFVLSPETDCLHIPALYLQKELGYVFSSDNMEACVGFYSNRFAVMFSQRNTAPKIFDFANKHGDSTKFLALKTKRANGRRVLDDQGQSVQEQLGVDILTGFLNNIPKIVRDPSYSSFFASYVKMVANSIFTTPNPAETEIYRVLLLSNTETLDQKTKYGQMVAFSTLTHVITLAAFSPDSHQIFFSKESHHLGEIGSFSIASPNE